MSDNAWDRIPVTERILDPDSSRLTLGFSSCCLGLAKDATQGLTFVLRPVQSLLGVGVSAELVANQTCSMARRPEIKKGVPRLGSRGHVDGWLGGVDVGGA